MVVERNIGILCVVCLTENLETLFYATTFEHVQQLVLSHSANVYVYNHQREFPLLYAIKRQLNTVWTILLQFNYEDYDIHRCIRSTKHVELLQALFQKI